MRLLIVEDELDFAQALARGLRQQGYAIDVALDGVQGWELAEVNEYDLLILDLNLPEMDGQGPIHAWRSLRHRWSFLRWIGDVDVPAVYSLFIRAT